MASFLGRVGGAIRKGASIGFTPLSLSARAANAVVSRTPILRSTPLRSVTGAAARSIPSPFGGGGGGGGGSARAAAPRSASSGWRSTPATPAAPAAPSFLARLTAAVNPAKPTAQGRSVTSDDSSSFGYGGGGGGGGGGDPYSSAFPSASATAAAGPSTDDYSAATDNEIIRSVGYGGDSDGGDGSYDMPGREEVDAEADAAEPVDGSDAEMFADLIDGETPPFEYHEPGDTLDFYHDALAGAFEMGSRYSLGSFTDDIKNAGADIGKSTALSIVNAGAGIIQKKLGDKKGGKQNYDYTPPGMSTGKKLVIGAAVGVPLIYLLTRRHHTASNPRRRQR